MKKQWCSVLIAFVFLSGIHSIAQCGMYTYQDVTADDSGNAIGDNLVQATSSCQQSSTSAEGHFTMPSGAQFAATAYGADIAEAVAYAPFANEDGNGSFWGNAITSSDFCGYYNGSAFSIPIRIAVATYARDAVYPDGYAHYHLACPNGNEHATCGTTKTWDLSLTFGLRSSRCIQFRAAVFSLMWFSIKMVPPHLTHAVEGKR